MSPLRLEELPPQVVPEQENAEATSQILKWLEALDQTPAESGGLGAATPAEFLLGSLRDGRLRVAEPISVSRTAESGQIVLEAHELNEFGFGGNVSEAIADLQTAIAELYFTLDAEQDRLGPALAAVRETLTRKIRRADAHLRP